MQPRVVQPSPALVSARDAVARLIIDWDNELADRIAAENLFSIARRIAGGKEIEDLRSKVGACSARNGFDRVESALRGTWTMSCERGALQVSITLAPTMPPTVQYLSVRPPQPLPTRCVPRP